MAEELQFNKNFIMTETEYVLNNKSYIHETPGNTKIWFFVAIIENGAVLCYSLKLQ